MSDEITRRKVLEAAAAAGALSTPALAGDGASSDQTSSNTIDYRDLTKDAKREFNIARSEGRAGLGRPRESPPQLLRNDYVRRRNQLYRLRVGGRFTARYGGTIARVETDPSSVDAVPFSELSNAARRAFRNGGRVVCRSVPAGYPRELVDNQHVVKNGDVYATNPQVRDGILNQLHVEEV